MWWEEKGKKKSMNCWPRLSVVAEISSDMHMHFLVSFTHQLVINWTQETKSERSFISTFFAIKSVSWWKIMWSWKSARTPDILMASTLASTHNQHTVPTRIHTVRSLAFSLLNSSLRQCSVLHGFFQLLSGCHKHFWKHTYLPSCQELDQCNSSTLRPLR